MSFSVSRTFTAVVSWGDRSFRGVNKDVYEIVFSKDLKEVEDISTKSYFNEKLIETWNSKFDDEEEMIFYLY